MTPLCVHYIVFQIINILGNLGGLLGLWLGLSAMSLLEILDFMFDIQAYINAQTMLRRSARARANNSVSPSAPPFDPPPPPPGHNNVIDEDMANQVKLVAVKAMKVISPDKTAISRNL